MRSLRIEICNERLLPRFGVDRFLVLLAQRLVDSGHEVSFACLRCDPAMLASISEDLNLVEVPPGLDMAGTESAIAASVAKRWERDRPDVVVTGGWPFFQVAAEARSHGIKSIFIDAGAVAQDSLVEPSLQIQQELRRIRQITLPLIDLILPISEFIKTTQSEPDRGSDVGIRTVLLGADHMRLGTFSPDRQSTNSNWPTALDERLQRGEKLLLCLGRFEPQGYKNSAVAYDLLRIVQNDVPMARLLVLDAGHDCKVPDDLQDSVILLGAPNDHSLQEIMQRSAAGVSMSLWEGFNLPLAEMQWLSRPAFAFNIGAHPEIVVHPWLLSETVREMGAKVVSFLKGENSPDLGAGFARFRQTRTWEVTLATWETEIFRLTDERSPGPATVEDNRRVILVDVSNASRDPANPGVIRVARRLSAMLHQHSDLEVVFIAWSSDAQGFIFLDDARRRFLQTYGGPTEGLGLLAAYRPEITVSAFAESLAIGRPLSPVLFMPETLLDGQALPRIAWAHTRGLKTAAILFDLIPVFHSDLCGSNITQAFPQYLGALTRADAVWPISQFTLDEFARYVNQNSLPMPATAEALMLPGQFGEQPRNISDASINGEFRILCVSTLEPRKNHLRLLNAFETLRNNRPELPLRLVLIGNRYTGAPQIAEQVQSATRRDERIEWHGIVDDFRLAEEYGRASFTVYPSLVEGFGLPILESIWMGRPCVTHCDGVMHELASGGGCVTVDMTNTQELARVLERMASDRSLLAELLEQAKSRHVTTWEEYGDQIADRLIGL